jgi:hypothetical protein
VADARIFRAHLSLAPVRATGIDLNQASNSSNFGKPRN